MPITLVETTKELAQAAVAVDSYIDEEYRERILADFSFDEKEEKYHPIIETVVVDGEDVKVPRTTLRDHTRLEAEELTISLESDVNLEGRMIDAEGNVIAPLAEPESSSPIGPQTITITVERKTNWLGWDPYYGGSSEGEWQYKGEPVLLKKVRFYQGGNANHFSLVFDAQYDYDPFVADAIITITRGNSSFDVNLQETKSATATDDDGSKRVSFAIGQANGDVLRSLQDGDTFTISFTDPHAVEVIKSAVKEELEAKQSDFDIMVTLRQGLDPNAARLAITAKFVRKPVAEGAAKLNDALNHNLGNTLV